MVVTDRTEYEKRWKLKSLWKQFWVWKTSEYHSLTFFVETPSGLRRVKRSVAHTKVINDEHLLAKLVLLHSLGNAGLNRSLPHLLYYAEPNMRQPDWRRGAIGAMRHYVCEQVWIATSECANIPSVNTRCMVSNITRITAQCLLPTAQSIVYWTACNTRAANSPTTLLIGLEACRVSVCFCPM